MMKPASRFVKAKRSYGSRAQRPLFFALGLFTAAAFAQTGSVLTYHYDNARTGQNTQETTLTPANISGGGFGKLFSQSVDGQVYAQPLYVPNVNIPGKGAHNVVLVATEGDTVYAFDADSNAGANAAPLWKTSMLGPGETPGANADMILDPKTVETCNDIRPQIGVTSTPVIDSATGTVYVEAKSKDSGGNYIHRLHALDLASGQEKFAGPVVITASAFIQGGAGMRLFFDPKLQNCRSGLLLAGGTVYIGYASHCDFGPYHGWALAYDATTLQQKAVFNTTPNGGLGGIWMSGGGLAADTGGNVYFSTGNGTFDTTFDAQGHPANGNYGDSVIKLSGSSLALLDYFTPSNQFYLNARDLDLASGGILLLPDQPGNYPHLLVQACKEGTIYLINREQMTAGNAHYIGPVSPPSPMPPTMPPNDTQIVEELPYGLGSGSPGYIGYCAPVYWNGSVYFWAVDDSLKAFHLTNGLLSRTPAFISTEISRFPGVNMSVSSNGTSAGILWALKTDSVTPGGQPSAAAGLRAYDLAKSSRLYSSDDNPGRDNPGIAVKFSVPTVVNGKVYVGAADRLSVFGLLQDFSMSVTPASQTVTAGGSASYTITVTPLNGFNSNVTLSVPANLPAGISVSFNPTVIPGGSGSSTMTVTTQPTTAPASLTGPITGTGGGLTHSANATLVVAGFILSAATDVQSVIPGHCTTYAMSVSDVNGFVGTVTLAPPAGLPAGATYSYSQNPISGSGSFALTVCTPASTPLQNYPLTITGMSGALSQSAHVTLAVTDFSLSVTPGSLSTGRGIGVNFMVTVAPINGFMGPVTLSAPNGLPAGATYTYSVNPVTVGNGPASAVLIITPASTGVLGSFPWTITGTAPGATHSAGGTLNVTYVTTMVRPTIHAPPSTYATEYINPAYAMDGNAGTYASGPGLSSFTGENYSGFGGVGGPLVAVNLKITTAASINYIMGSYVSLYYSLDNGSTWSSVYFLYGGATSRGLQTDVIPLSTSQNFAGVLVQAACNGGGSQQVYDAWIEATH